MKKETRVTHQPSVVLPPGNEPVVAPIYRSVKFTYPTLEASRSAEARDSGFDYTRDSNPTTRQLEQLTAELQDREDAIVVATGMAAIWLALLGNLSAGDELVIFLESYRPARVAVRKMLARFGIGYTMLSMHDEAARERAFAKTQCKLVLFEAPTNPMLQVPDIAAVVRQARAHGLCTVLDNTFAGLHNHGSFDVDYYVHSLTKYASGHGDVMGGVVIANRDKIRSLRPLAVNMGATIDPGVSYLILRGLRTYYLRYRRQSESALEIARFLRSQPGVERVYYPGLPDDPGHELARRQMSDFGGVLSFDLQGGARETARFVDALELFVTTSSIGSTESLVAPVKVYWGNDLTSAELEQAKIGDGTVRLSIGLEHPDDLIDDLKQAFARALA
jgi:cystathionine beta-lyase/cystathionine gamma-synthase